MDIRIIKSNITHCDICEEVRAARDTWNSEQEKLVEDGIQEEMVVYPGVIGYIIKDTDEYSFGRSHICEDCMNTIIKGVNLINTHKLTSISQNSK